MKHRLLAGAAVACLALSLVPSSDGSATFRPRQSPAFLGFHEGEERRYVLGPPHELLEGEAATWSIHLRELVGDPPEGIFWLTHEWQRGEHLVEPAYGTIVYVKSEGTLRVNAHGFPLDVSFTTERHLVGFGDEAYTVRYRYRDGNYQKHNAMDGRDWTLTAVIRSHPQFDRDIPSGLYAFAPWAPDCSMLVPGSTRTARVVPPYGGVPKTPPAPPSIRGFADNSRCNEALFSNPGLISLMMPALWEQGTGTREFLLLTPVGPGDAPGLQVGGVPGVRRPRRAGADSRFNPRTHSTIRRLRLQERVDVVVGRRTLPAWLLDRLGDYDAVYVDDDGVVLRADVAETIWRSLFGRDNDIGVDPPASTRRGLHVRLLFPSEF